MCHLYVIQVLVVSLIFMKQKNVNADPQTISTVLNTEGSGVKNFIQIRNPPYKLTKRRAVIVEYKCNKDTIVGVEIIANMEGGNKNVKVFHERWRCLDQSADSKVHLKRIKIKLPASLAYNYNAFNTNVTMANGAKLMSWILDSDWLEFCQRHDDYFFRSRVKVSYKIAILPPYSRPFFKKKCRKWSYDIVTMATANRIPQCAFEQEMVRAIEYPVVLGGLPYGVYRKLHPYTNPVLEQQRKDRFNKPRFTVAIWMYILEYCPGRNVLGKTCGIMFHFSWNVQLKTVMIMLKPEGDLHIQVEHVDKTYSAGRTHKPLPLKQWLRLVVSFNVHTWTVVVNYGKDFKNITESSFQHTGPPVYFDDTEGLFTFGGAEHFQSFRGYIGQATIYRNKIIHHKQIPYPSPFHPMFELNLTPREERCHRYMNWVDQRINLYKVLLDIKIESKTCRHQFYNLLTKRLEPDFGIMCPLRARTQRRHWAIVDGILRQKVYRQQSIDVKDISDQLYSNATYLIEEDISNIPSAVPILKQSACYGNNDAMYVLSVILNNGLFVKADEIQSQAFLMLAALENHRLSQLGLGHKHRYGLDGVTLDLEQSFRYYKYVADTTSRDKEIHKDTDVLTESIRLTDEVALKEQTDEDGDIFHWLKHQAKQGVLSAQARAGRLLYWGSHGLKRNLEGAMEYFRMSAETGDAQSQYDYGIVLMRGQGTKKDIEKGLEQINKAAEQQNDQALNALGWHAKEFQKDNTKAAEFFEKAYRKGNPDAAHNLGIMHLHGNYPGMEADADKALAYFQFAASRGQLDAGVALAYQTIKGTGKQPRDVYVAAEWSRFIAEKNPEVGIVLRKAMKAYRDGKTDLALFYYAMAADAGLEVGSFNMAWLCEENQGGITSFIEKECQWRHYNLTTLREPQFVDPYALIKMGDYYWYGCRSKRDTTKAANYYAEAASKHNPQALFNIAFMVEEGVSIPRETLDFLRIPKRYQKNNVTLLDHLYTRCKESRESEAFIPCSIALWRLHITVAWTQYQTFVKIAGFTGVVSVLVASACFLLRSHFRPTTPNMNTI